MLPRALLCTLFRVFIIAIVEIFVLLAKKLLTRKQIENNSGSSSSNNNKMRNERHREPKRKYSMMRDTSDVFAVAAPIGKGEG